MPENNGAALPLPPKRPVMHLRLPLPRQPANVPAAIARCSVASRCCWAPLTQHPTQACCDAEPHHKATTVTQPPPPPPLPPPPLLMLPPPRFPPLLSPLPPLLPPLLRLCHGRWDTEACACDKQQLPTPRLGHLIWTAAPGRGALLSGTPTHDRTFILPVPARLPSPPPHTDTPLCARMRTLTDT